MRYNYLLLLLAFKTTHSLVFIVNTNQNNKPKIIVPPQVSETSTKKNNSKTGDSGNSANVKSIVYPINPIRPIVDFAFVLVD
jgi:hypothetical protein